MPPAHSNPVSISGFLNHKKKNSQGKNKEKRWKVQDYFSKIEQNNLANYCSFLLKFFYCLYKSVAKQIRLSRAIQWHLQIYEYIRRVFFIMSYSLFKIKCGGKTSIINQLLSIIFQGAINLPWIPNKNKFLKNYQKTDDCNNIWIYFHKSWSHLWSCEHLKDRFCPPLEQSFF